MKIVHIAECAGGVERYLQMLIPLLKEQGVNQSIICSQNFVKDNFNGFVDGYHEIKMYQSFSPSLVFKTIAIIRKILKKEHPDIIYCHSSFGGTLGRVAAIGLNAKIVYNPHGWSFNDQSASKIKRVIYAFIERVLAPLTNKYVAISNFEKKNALNFHVTSADKIQVIFNGLEIDKYKTRIKRSRKELGIPIDAVVIGMVGRLSKGKSPDIFTHMASILKKKIPNAFFIIVGDGEDRQKTEDLIKKLDLQNCFLITGWVDNVYDYEDAFDYAVLLTKWEGFGLAVAEYMLCKKPLVSTNVGGIPDIVKDGYNGILIDDISAECAAKAILKYYYNSDYANIIANNAFNYANKYLDIKRTVMKHYRLFKNILA